MENEAQIIEGCIKNDRQCETLLYQKYAPLLYGIALRYSQREEDAQDVLQEAFCRIFSNIKQHNQTGSLVGWLIRVVINQALTYRKQHFKFRLEDYKDYEESIADETIVVSDKLTHNILLRFIRELPQGDQDAFNLCAIDKYSYRDASKVLHCTETACRMRLHRARTLLKRRVDDFLKSENK